MAMTEEKKHHNQCLSVTGATQNAEAGFPLG